MNHESARRIRAARFRGAGSGEIHRSPPAAAGYSLSAPGQETDSYGRGGGSRGADENESTYISPGASSPARTPLAEPIFLIEADKINPERLELYRLEVKGGQREITVSQKRRGGPRPLKLSVTRIDGRLFRVEAGEMLENGQYSLSPSDSNTAFCFEVY